MAKAFVVDSAENTLVFRFGGGLNTRASEDEIREIEAADGQNFALDPRNRELRNRKGFELLGTAPNAGEIRGGATLRKTDGTVSMLVQAGGKVYEWDGTSFTDKGSVSSTAQLRGTRASNFLLNDEVIITDLNLQQPVMVWDGTTLSTMTENLTGDFLAKYCTVRDERAFFANVISNSVHTPHMLVGSKRGDNTVLSVSSRPASGATATDPFFLLSPDLKPINGLISAFQRLVFSSDRGKLFQLTGFDKTDYAIGDFYEDSGCSGDESLVHVGNDVVYGREGRIESLLATDKFGDVEANDLSIDIRDQIESFADWTNVYNARLDRVYLLPGGNQSELWVLHKSIPEVSPWSRWKTQHASSFQPTFMMNMLDPVDGMEYVYFGDSSGNFYRLESENDDDANASILTSFTSKLFSAPFGGNFSEIDGWIKYRSNEAFTTTITLLWSGEQVFNESITVSASAVGGSYWGGDVFWGGDFYWGSAFFNRIVRQRFGIPGLSNDFQLRVEVDGTTTFRINEIGLRFKTSS